MIVILVRKVFTLLICYRDVFRYIRHPAWNAPVSAQYVGRTSRRQDTSEVISPFTSPTGHTIVSCVAEDSTRTLTWSNIKGYTQERNPTSVICVARRLLRAAILMYTKVLINSPKRHLYIYIASGCAAYLLWLRLQGIYPGFPPYLENLEFCHFLFQAWKMPGICSKSGKNLNKNVKFANYMFQASLFKMSFTKIILIYFFVITNTDWKPNWPWISLLLPGYILENTWNFVSQEKWDPCICFNTFRDFYN